MTLRALDPLAGLAHAERFDTLGSLGGAGMPVLAIDLRDVDRTFRRGDRDERLRLALAGSPWVNVALVSADLDPVFAPLVDAFDVVLGSDMADREVVIDSDDVDRDLELVGERVGACPQASVALVQLLRTTHDLPVAAALHFESLTYAVLQSGSEFGQWLANRTPRDPSAADRPRVRVARSDSSMHIELDRPERRNAIDIAMRDELFEALSLLLADPSIDGAVLSGRGPTFSAGGDLAEFGTTPSPAIGHRVRTLRSLPRLFDTVAGRLRVHLHGPCVGAGIELPAFAHSVVAHPDSTFRLPEVSFGLIPGAGGTVSVTRRCGRHRTAWLAITGEPIDAGRALGWRLVDRIDETPAG